MTNRVTVIEWIDSVSFSSGNWKRTENMEDLEPDRIVSAGFIQKETSNYITIAAHVGDDEAAGEMCIPRVAIKKIRHFSIKPKKPKRKPK